MKDKLKKTIITFFVLLFFLVHIFAQKSAAEYIKSGYVKAIVLNKKGIDGCGFVIKLEKNEIIQPLELDKKFQKNKLKIWVKFVVPKKSPASICMMGKIVEITFIEKRK